MDVLDLRDWTLPVFGENFATLGDPANPTFSVPDLAWWAAVLQRARRQAPLPPAIMRRRATEGAR